MGRNGGRNKIRRPTDGRKNSRELARAAPEPGSGTEWRQGAAGGLGGLRRARDLAQQERKPSGGEEEEGWVLIFIFFFFVGRDNYSLVLLGEEEEEDAEAELVSSRGR